MYKYFVSAVVYKSLSLGAGETGFHSEWANVVIETKRNVLSEKEIFDLKKLVAKELDISDVKNISIINFILLK